MTYPSRGKKMDVEIGGFRWINLKEAHCNLSQPLAIVLETEGATSGKSMALWDVTAL